MKKAVAVVALALAGCVCVRQDASPAFANWSRGTSPEEVGTRIAERFLSQPHSQYGRVGKAPKQITYPDVCAWYGSLAFAQATANAPLSARLAQRFEPLFGADARLVPVPNHVDNSVFGAVPLELYMQTKEARYLTMGKTIADAQWAAPQGKDDTPDARALLGRGWR